VNRRGFLRGMLALGVAPAVVKSGVLMKVKPLLLPGEDFEVGHYYGFRYIESEFPMVGDPVNFIFMKKLLEEARKKLPYFNAELPGRWVPMSEYATVGVRMTQAG